MKRRNSCRQLPADFHLPGLKTPGREVEGHHAQHREVEVEGKWKVEGGQRMSRIGSQWQMQDSGEQKLVIPTCVLASNIPSARLSLRPRLGFVPGLAGAIWHPARYHPSLLDRERLHGRSRDFRMVEVLGRIVGQRGSLGPGLTQSAFPPSYVSREINRLRVLCHRFHYSVQRPKRAFARVSNHFHHTDSNSLVTRSSAKARSWRYLPLGSTGPLPKDNRGGGKSSARICLDISILHTCGLFEIWRGFAFKNLAAVLSENLGGR
jgi:hypothetical protein